VFPEQEDGQKIQVIANEQLVFEAIGEGGEISVSESCKLLEEKRKAKIPSLSQKPLSMQPNHSSLQSEFAHCP
jgi:hypothetical protein